MGLKVGVIGCGRQAPKHISGLVGRGDVEIIVADERPERARSLAESHPVIPVAGAEEIFADRAIDAVVVCTPPASHGALIRRAIAAGKHFICEKPLSTDLTETRALEFETRRAGLVGMTAYIYRFAPAFELAAKVLDGGGSDGCVLGRPASALLRIGGPGSHDAWQHRSETGGGAINEMLVHMVDLVLWLLGPLKSAEVLAAGVRKPRRSIGGREFEADAEDWITVRLETEGGVDVLIAADLTTPVFVQYAEIHATNGSFMGSIQSEMATFVHCVEERNGFAAGRTSYRFEPCNLYEPQMALFLDSVTGKTVLDRCTLTESVRLMEAIDLLRPGENIRGRSAIGN